MGSFLVGRVLLLIEDIDLGDFVGAEGDFQIADFCFEDSADHEKGQEKISLRKCQFKSVSV